MSAHATLVPQTKKFPLTLKKIGFIIKREDPEAEKLAQELTEFLIHKGLSVVFASESETLAQRCKVSLKKQASSKISYVAKEKLPEKVDLIVVLGGDGTLLSIARLMEKRSVPVLGINMGHLGFLTAAQATDALPLLQKIIEEKSVFVSERVLLNVSLIRKKKTIFNGLVVNDAVLSKGAISRIIGIEISINKHGSYKVSGDGIIVSTPTGSTAYSLSAGGSLITPTLKAIGLTPICPHSLTQRPLVITDDATIQIRLIHRPGHVFLTLDGQDAIDIQEDDIVIIERFKKHPLRLVFSQNYNYFDVLRDKLHFGQCT